MKLIEHSGLDTKRDLNEQNIRDLSKTNSKCSANTIYKQAAWKKCLQCGRKNKKTDNNIKRLSRSLRRQTAALHDDDERKQLAMTHLLKMDVSNTATKED